MRTCLSAIGWIDQPPEGNRLRWTLPAGQVAADGHIVPFPDRILVQRAPVSADFVTFGHEAGPSLQALAYPEAMWSAPRDIGPAPLFQSLKIDLGPGVQAVHFRYAGATEAPLKLFDTNGIVIRRLTVSPGQEVYLEATDAGALHIAAVDARVQGLRTLDAFADIPAAWETIAEIAFDAGLVAPFADAAARYGQGTTMTAAQWADVTELAREARNWTPPAPDADSPDASPFEGLALFGGLKWQYAVIMGLGFRDGPHVRSPLDRVSDTLSGQPAGDLLYRIVPLSPDRAYRPSNIVPVRHGTALPLAVPKTPAFSQASVRLRSDNPKPAPDPAYPFLPTALKWLERPMPYSAAADLAWGVYAPHAIGVEIEEEHSASPIMAAPPSLVRYTCRTRADTDTPAAAVQPRRFEVPFPDVRIRASARAVDGWDRLSPASPFSPWTPLDLQHAPRGPAITAADYSAGTVSLSFEDDWSADPIVTATNGIVEILRQTAAPRTQAVEVASVGPVPGSDGRLTATFTVPVPKPWEFAGGSFSIDTLVLPIAAITATGVQFPLSEIDGAQIFTKGKLTLKQSPHYAGLWSQVAGLPVQPFPTDFSFADVLPVDPKTAALTYATRLSYWGGRRGPLSGLRQALVHRAPLVVPPPFTVTILGLDFFRRALVRIRLDKPEPSGRFRLFVADGVYNPADRNQAIALSQAAEPALHGARAPTGGTDLIDIVNLPLLAHQTVAMTFALQRVDDSGGASDFSAIVCTVPSLA